MRYFLVGPSMPSATASFAGQPRRRRQALALAGTALLTLGGCREAPRGATPEARHFPLGQTAQELVQDAPGSHWSGTWYQQPSTMGQRIRITHLGDGLHVIEHHGNVLDPQALSGDDDQLASVEAGDRQRFRLFIENTGSRCARMEQLHLAGFVVRARLCRE